MQITYTASLFTKHVSLGRRVCVQAHVIERPVVSFVQLGWVDHAWCAWPDSSPVYARSKQEIKCPNCPPHYCTNNQDSNTFLPLFVTMFPLSPPNGNGVVRDRATDRLIGTINVYIRHVLCRAVCNRQAQITSIGACVDMYADNK